MKVTKKAALGLAALLAASVVVAGCGNDNNNDQQSQTSPTNTTITDELKGKYDPPITMHAALAADTQWKYPEGDNYSNNFWTRTYESKLGIKIKYDWIAKGGQQTGSDPYNSDYNTKFNISIADIPDLFMVNAAQLKQLADADQLADLTEVFDKYADDTVKKYLNGDGGLSLKSASFNGKLLAIPTISSTIYNAPVVWVRTDWMKKLNQPEPKTMQDVLAIADAFTNKDPDGDGKKNTFGLAVSKNVWDLFAGLDGFFEGYHAYPKIWVKDASGSVGYGSVQPEMKTALAKLQELFKAGMIDPEFGVKDASKLKEEIINNKFGLLYGVNWAPYEIAAQVQKDPTIDWKPFPLVSIDDKAATPAVDFPTTQYYAVKKSFKNPEAAIKMLNLYYQARYHLDKYLEAELNPKDANGNPSYYDTWKASAIQAEKPDSITVEDLNRVADAIKKKDKSIVQGYDYDGYYDIYNTFINDKDMKQWAPVRQGADPDNSAFKILVEEYYNNKTILTTEFGGQTQTMTEKWNTLYKTEIETFTKIIMGASSIDEFDTFVASWKKLGGDQITKEINAFKASQK